MISRDTKDSIEKEALVEFPERLIGTHTGSIYDQNEHDRAIWKEGATKYAEKLEEKDKAYNELGVKFDKEVERWQERDANEFEKRRVLEVELAQLKEIAERMVKILKTSDIEDEDEELEDVLMTYAEWCK